jgi:hypothetical protein
MSAQVRRGVAGVVAIGIAALLAGCSSSAPQTGAQAQAPGTTLASETPATGLATELTTTSPSAPETVASVDSTADSPVGSDTPPPKLCDLINEQDAVAAFGEPVRLVNDDSYQCFWKSEGAGLKGININRDTPDLAEWRLGHDNDSWEKNDFGEEGFSSKVFDSIEFRIGDTVYDLNVNYSTEGDPRKIVNDLAKLVLSRL